MNDSQSEETGSFLPGWVRGILYWCGAVLGPIGTGLLVLILIVMLFYQEENWRGRRAWARAQAEAAASGKVTDWNAFIPPPVPDDQNFFAAPHMHDWFTGRGSREISKRMAHENFENSLKEPDAIIANVTIVPPDAIISPGDADIVLRYHCDTLSVSEKPSKVTVIKPSAEIIPLITMDEVPLSAAIKNLASQAGVNYGLDPAIHFDKLVSGIPAGGEPKVTAKWMDHTALSALQMVLKTNHLVIVPDMGRGMIRITTPDRASHADPEQHVFTGSELVLTKVEEPPMEVGEATNVIPFIVMDDVPLTIAIKKLAEQANIAYRLDEKINYRFPQPTVTLRWTNLTAPTALDAVLANYNLERKHDPRTGVALISIKDNSKNFNMSAELTARMRGFITDAFVPATNGNAGEHLTAALGFEISARPVAATKPVRIIVRADSVPYTNEIVDFFPNHRLGANAPWMSQVLARSTSSNTFQVYFDTPPLVSAQKYLEWSDKFQDDLAAIRSAAKRPYARMAGDYTDPINIPIPNFVTLRLVAQTLSQRAQCHLLLHQPDKAVEDLALMRGICRICEARPTGRPMTLVAAMVNTAMTGLYLQVIGEGFQMNAWREQDLAALEAQLAEIDLVTLLYGGLDCERVSAGFTIEHLTAQSYKKMQEKWGSKPKSDWEYFKDPIYQILVFGPTGWKYQNMAVVARFHQDGLGGVDMKNKVMVPHVADAVYKEVDQAFNTKSKFHPFIEFAAMMVPNFSRASQTVTKNQSLANQTLIVCALERYRLAHGSYPETLDALMPQFIDALPHDVIGGKPLEYARKDTDYTLGTLGWDEKTYVEWAYHRN